MTEDPPTVVLKAPAKLTLSLRITAVRPNGYHEIDAEMVTIDLCDDVEITPAAASSIELVDATPDVPAGPDNMVYRALQRVDRQARVRLVKRIPSLGGLGGGSADAAAVLRWAGVTDPVSVVGLGSDVAFCLHGGRARVTGAGEQIEPLPYVEREVTLLFPPLQCSTVDVFGAWDSLDGPTGPGDNDLERAALAVAPGLARYREQLGELTGKEPQLAGSGSTWFVHGAFEGPGLVVAKTVPTGWNG